MVGGGRWAVGGGQWVGEWATELGGWARTCWQRPAHIKWARVGHGPGLSSAGGCNSRCPGASAAGRKPRPEGPRSLMHESAPLHAPTRPPPALHASRWCTMGTPRMKSRQDPSGASWSTRRCALRRRPSTRPGARRPAATALSTSSTGWMVGGGRAGGRVGGGGEGRALREGLSATAARGRLLSVFSADSYCSAWLLVLH